MTFDPAAFAAQLVAARRARTPMDDAPPDYAAGIAVQREVARLRGADPPAGFKIGATTARMRDYLGVSAPVAGFMRGEDLHAAGSVLSHAGFTSPGVECELAVVLGRDLPATPCSPAQAATAVAEVRTSIEVVENRYGKLAADPALLVADSMYHAACVLGEPGPAWQELDLRSIEGVIAVDGHDEGRGAGAELLGGPMEALAWLAGSPEAAAFGGLREGQVVTLGSVTTPVWLPGPCTVTVSFPPLPPVSLTLV